MPSKAHLNPLQINLILRKLFCYYEQKLLTEPERYMIMLLKPFRIVTFFDQMRCEMPDMSFYLNDASEYIISIASSYQNSD